MTYLAVLEASCNASLNLHIQNQYIFPLYSILVGVVRFITLDQLIEYCTGLQLDSKSHALNQPYNLTAHAFTKLLT